MIPLYSGLLTSIFLTGSNMFFLSYTFKSAYELQLWEYIFAIFAFNFWGIDVLVLSLMMHLLTNLLIFQSEVGITQVEVKREEHF